MRTHSIKILGFLFILFALCSFTSGDKELKKDETILKLMYETINSTHFNPNVLDDAFSQKTYSLYLKRLDINKRFLIKSDIDKLKKYESQIDDEIREGNFDFFDLSIKLLQQRITDGEAITKTILDKPFDFTTNESIETDPEKKDFPKDEKALKEEWRKMLKYETLIRIDEQLAIQEKAKTEKDTSVKIKSFAEIEKDAREKIGKRYDEFFKRVAKEDRDDRLSLYLNCITNVFDPHSDYFPAKEKENFDIQMSGQLEGIGATLQEKDGYIRVAQIVPGSPSWKQGQLKEGDLILKVAQGKEEPVDIVDMRLDNAVKLIRGKKGTEVRLTVKKPDNSIVPISIIRDVVILEETFAKSVILEVPGSDKKIGYLYLPSFYADFQNPNGRRAYKDVKAEVEKLKSENISGLIFDLRNDGGGSLQDAVDIAGLFIEKGPVVQVKSRFGPPYVYEDKNPEITYDGPLMVMVNAYSASASEIFAAAMQDYNRAIIVGTPNTFGKGTVQRFFELDKALPREDQDMKPLGSVKVTIQKFYRINGGSTQLKGVTPDVTFPDMYQYIDRGEMESEYPLQWTKIDPVPYTKWRETLPYASIKSEVDNIVRKDTIFNLITENALRLKSLKEKSIVNLNLEKYRAEQKKNKEEVKRFERIGKDTTGIIVAPLLADVSKSRTDSASVARVKSWYNTLKKDVYLYQTTRAMDQNFIIGKK